MKGSVNISLEDFENLKKAADTGKKAVELAKGMDLALTHLVGYLAKSTDVEALADRYNAGPYASKLIYKGRWILQQK